MTMWQPYENLACMMLALVLEAKFCVVLSRQWKKRDMGVQDKDL